jgi:proline iminopeptidase
MHVLVNGVRLFFDVEGAKLAPDGGAMRTRPTVILLHGGPGFDHSMFKPRYAALAEVAQIVYLDHRGNGRSEAGPRELWTLAQWGDDVRGFCDALGIEKPIVLGVSFGGFVAIAYATRHPAHPGKLILSSTAAKGDAHRERSVALFERFGGAALGALARRRLIELADDDETLAAWIERAFPHYNRAPPDPALRSRARFNPEVRRWFMGRAGEWHRFDFLPALARIQCPTLVLGGEDDPMTPIECQADIAAALPRHLVRFERFVNAGHHVVHDAPERAFRAMREFIGA